MDSANTILHTDAENEAMDKMVGIGPTEYPTLWKAIHPEWDASKPLIPGLTNQSLKDEIGKLLQQAYDKYGPKEN